MLPTLLVLTSLLSLGSAIVNGTVAGRFQFPFMVSLQWDGQHKCGGTLLDANTILTAAHCYPLVWVDQSQPQRVTALLGSRNRFSGGRWPSKRFGIQRVIWPDNFPDKYKTKTIMSAPLSSTPFDYLLLKLNHSVRESRYIKYAKLGDRCGRPVKPKVGDRCVPIGWGRYQSPDVKNATAEIFPKYLQRGLVEIVPDNACWDKKKPVATMMCAKEVIRFKRPRGLPCFGDSGSPLVCRKDGREYVAGFVEAGTAPCNYPSAEAYFMRISTVRQWIYEHL